MKTLGWRSIPLVLFVLLVIFLWRGLSLDPHALPSVQIGKPLPVFQRPRLDNPQTQVTEKDLQGQVALLNVWASWCEACVEEQVLMLQLAREGVTLYGLNYKDQHKDAKHWLEDWGNPYRLIIEDKDGRLGIDLGVYGTPETFLLDAEGTIRYRHVGILTEKDWQREFLPRIQQLEQSA